MHKNADIDKFVSMYTIFSTQLNTIYIEICLYMLIYIEYFFFVMLIYVEIYKYFFIDMLIYVEI